MRILYGRLIGRLGRGAYSNRGHYLILQLFFLVKRIIPYSRLYISVGITNDLLWEKKTKLIAQTGISAMFYYQNFVSWRRSAAR